MAATMTLTTAEAEGGGGVEEGRAREEEHILKGWVVVATHARWLGDHLVEIVVEPVQEEAEELLRVLSSGQQ
jgi:hypothetical protein